MDGTRTTLAELFSSTAEPTREKQRPKNGRKIRPSLTPFKRVLVRKAGHFFHDYLLVFIAQARAVWTWSNYLHSVAVVSGKQIVRVNIDETSIKLDMVMRHGFISAAARNDEKHSGLRRKMSKRRARTAYSYVAVLCDDADLQKLMPQIIIVNSTQCPEAVFEEVNKQKPSNVIIWRRKSCWMDTATFGKVIRQIHSSLGRKGDSVQIILCCDGHNTHINTKIWQICSRMKYLMFVIPAKTTGVLQPLDAYVFALLKSKLRTAYQSNCILLTTGSCSLGLSVMTLFDVIKEVLLSRPWHHAWERLGLAGHQRNISTRVLNCMNVPAIATVPCCKPTLAELCTCFPLRYTIDVEAVFSGVVTVVSPAKAAPFRRLPSSTIHMHEHHPVATATDSGSSLRLLSDLVEPVSSPSTWRPRVPLLHRVRPLRLNPLTARPMPRPPMPPPMEEPASRPRYLSTPRRTSWDTSDP